jgi:hypothetical protein
MRRCLPFLFLVLPAAGCPTSSTPTCAQVCARGAALGCEFAKPTPKGATCTTVCENLATSGLPAWDLACMAQAQTCEAMDACE